MDEVLQVFGILQGQRATFASQWEEIAELIMPSHRNTFYYGNYNWQGQKKTDRQIDSSGQIALSRFAAICNSLLTPRQMKWHGIGNNDPYVMKDRATQLFFEECTRVLFAERYKPTAGFARQNHSIFQSLGAFGTGTLFVDELDSPHGGRGLRYKGMPIGQMFLRENHQGIIDSFIRWMPMTARQIMQKWGKDKFPDALISAYNGQSETLYDILHYVCPNTEYEPGRVDDKGKAFRSVYICMQGKCVMQRGGYRTWPGPVSRYENAPSETYGRSVAMQVLPSLKTLNAQKRVFLTQGHRAAAPVLLAPDDGLIDFSMRPGALNKGGVNSDGKPLVHAMPSGDIQISKEMMAEEKALINDAFFVSIFQILTETPTMSATEVLERTNEKGILLAPTVGQQYDDYIGPMVERELDILMHMGKLPPMPPRLREAGGEYSIIPTSPLSRAMRAQEAAGFNRTLETVQGIVNVTQDPSYFDVFDFETAIPDLADINGVKPSYMASPEKVLAKKQQRAKQQQLEQRIQAAPAAAGMMKAQAAQVQAGMAPPDTGQAQPGGQ